MIPRVSSRYTSTSSGGYYGSNYLHDGRRGKGSKTATWTYLIATAGDYEVAAIWTSSSNRTPRAQYMYSIDGGPAQDCGSPADQRYNGGQFNLLCIIPAVAAGSTLTISLPNDYRYGFVIADAVWVSAP